MEPDSGAVPPLERAQTLCELRRFADAASLASQIIAAAPRNADAWCVMAEAQLGQEQPKAALQAALAAAAGAAHSAQPQRLASIALSKLGRQEESLLAARLAAQLEPDAWEAQVQLATALAASEGKLDEAGEAAARAVELAPEQVRAHHAAGSVAAAAGKRAEAVAAYRKALSLDPLNSVAYNELARLNLDRAPTAPGAERLTGAAAGFARTLRIDPRAAVTRSNLQGLVGGYLRWLAYALLLAALLTLLGGSRSVGFGARALPLLVLAVPAAIAIRFVRRLPASLRADLRHEVGAGLTRVLSALGLGGSAALVLGALASPGIRPALAVFAILAAIAERAAVRLDRRRLASG